MSLYPLLYSSILVNQQQAIKANQLRSEGLYLELVQFMTNTLPQRLIDIVQKQLLQLNTMNIKPIAEGATLQLEGDQYRAYTAVTNSITNSRHTGVHFFITGPGGTGKSFLLKSLEMWCHRSRQKPLLLSPTLQELPTLLATQFIQHSQLSPTALCIDRRYSQVTPAEQMSYGLSKF